MLKEIKRDHAHAPQCVQDGDSISISISMFV